MTANPAERLVNAGPPRQDMSLLRWVWRAYVRNALVPLLVVELLLVAVYLASHAWSLRKNVAALSEVARQEVPYRDDESAVIEQQLGHVASLAEVLAPDDGRLEARSALPGPLPPPRSRAGLSRPGMTTWRGRVWSARTKRDRPVTGSSGSYRSIRAARPDARESLIVSLSQPARFADAHWP